MVELKREEMKTRIRVVAGVQEEFQIVQAIVQGLGLGLGWRLGLETNHVPVCKT